MNDQHEIIVTLREDLTKPRVVQFSELYAIRDDMITMMCLWNTNCYYVDAESKTFIINGGRKITMDTMKNPKVIYRRRNQFEKGLNSEVAENKKVNWFMGLEDEDGTMVLLQISETGREWSWANKL
jgi:hypothetical protein